MLLTVFHYQPISGQFLSGDSSIARSKDLCYNLIRKCGQLCVKDYKAAAKARLRLTVIFFTPSTHVECVVLMSRVEK